MSTEKSKTVAVSKMALRQELDCCHTLEEAGGEYPTLNIEVHDGGGGAYVVIRTKHWALDKNDLLKLNNIINNLIDDYDQYEKMYQGRR
jgi:hypothetical protein